MLRRCSSLPAFFCLLALAAPAEAQTAKGKKYALVVGITEYDHSSLAKLNFTENDAEEMAKILKGKTAGYDEVRVLTTTRGNRNKKDAPTADNIKKALAELLTGKKRHDTVLIALAGHGVTLEVEDPDGKGPTKSFVFFCPSDADLQGVSYGNGTSKTLLNLSGVFASLGRCGAGTKMIFVDACRNLLKAESTTRTIDPKSVTVPDGVGAMFSCGKNQVAHESKKLKHGVFFHYVIQGLQGRAKNDDGEVTFGALGDYVQRQVSREVPKIVGGGAKQSPHVMKNYEGEPPVLTRPGKEAVTGKDGEKPRDKDREKPKDKDKLPPEPRPVKGELPRSGDGYVFSAVPNGIEARKDGELHWRAGPSGQDGAGAVRAFGYHDGRVYGYKGKVLFCLDFRSGKELWKVTLALRATGTVSLSREGGTLRVSNGLTLHRFDLVTGKEDKSD